MNPEKLFVFDTSVLLSTLADAIITGDEDLLVLHPFRGIPILNPAGFLALYP
jgi:hypothetical protein